MLLFQRHPEGTGHPLTLLGGRGKGPEKGEGLREGSSTTHVSLRRREEGEKEVGVLGRARAMEPGALGSSHSSVRDNCMIWENHFLGFTLGLSFSIWKMEL